jgi:hypothetical protein
LRPQVPVGEHERRGGHAVDRRDCLQAHRRSVAVLSAPDVDSDPRPVARTSSDETQAGSHKSCQSVQQLLGRRQVRCRHKTRVRLSYHSGTQNKVFETRRQATVLRLDGPNTDSVLFAGAAGVPDQKLRPDFVDMTHRNYSHYLHLQHSLCSNECSRMVRRTYVAVRLRRNDAAQSSF